MADEFLGIKVVLGTDIPPDTLLFVNEQGKVVAKIVCIGPGQSPDPAIWQSQLLALGLVTFFVSWLVTTVWLQWP